jgi:hypothetical protein
MGIGLKVGYDALNLGNDIKISGISIEANFRF